MKRSTLLLCLVTVLFTACSTSKRIGKYVHSGILKDAAIRHAHTGIVIFEPAADQYWYQYQGEKYFVPASNTKLATCYAALQYLGDSIAAIRYKIDADSTLTIRGLGDPTFLHPDFSRHPVYDFLENFNEIHLQLPAFHQYAGTGWSWDDYPYAYMALRSGLPIYGNLVHFQLDNGALELSPGFFQNNTTITAPITSGFSVIRPWDSNAFTISPGRSHNRSIPFVPDNTTLLGLLEDTLHIPVVIADNDLRLSHTMYSQPVDSLLQIMMHRSDNFFAEQSLLMVAQQLTGHLDEDSAINYLLTHDFKDMPQPPQWVDGSGLSHYNRFSPKDFVFLLRKMKDNFGMEKMETILPTGGEGTLSRLYHDLEGKIYAKTGTLNGVVALSGYLVTKKNKFLIFSILVNNHNTNASHVRKEIEKLVQYIQVKF